MSATIDTHVVGDANTNTMIVHDVCMYDETYDKMHVYNTYDNIYVHIILIHAHKYHTNEWSFL